MNDLLMNVMMLDFAVQDATLFIDTHPVFRSSHHESLEVYKVVI